MGSFKLFAGLLNYPDALIIIAFVFLLDIIILVKIDKLEKAVEALENKFKELEEGLKKLKEETESLGEDKDIIDTFLSQGGFEILHKTKKTTNKKSVKEAMKAPKISSLLDPNDSEEEEDE